MPWKKEDVDKHKKGLTEKGKEQWVSIANRVLEECRDSGKTDCDAEAIRKANSIVANGKLIDNFNIEAKEYEIREETHQGKKHLVVPVVMMVEGVHDGSQGPILHKSDELGRMPGAWNGIPVVIEHPTKEDMFVSANLPDVIDSEIVGRVYNTEMDLNKLRGEAWLDIERLESKSPLALGYIKQGEPIDVSIGVFTEEEVVSGDWNGEKYSAIARNHRPDHLALLPGGEGACSWADGCGIRANSKPVQLELNELREELRLLNKKKESMAKNDCPAKEKAEALILNKATKFTEKDREWLESQEQQFLDKLVPEAPKKTEVTDEKVLEVLTKKAKEDPDSFYDLLPDEMRESVKSGIAIHNEQRTKMIKDILANTKEVWAEDDLKDMNTEVLKKVHDSVKDNNVTDYSAMAGKNTSSTDDVLLPTGINLKEDE